MQCKWDVSSCTALIGIDDKEVYTRLYEDANFPVIFCVSSVEPEDVGSLLGNIFSNGFNLFTFSFLLWLYT